MSDLMREEFERTNGRDHRRNPPKGNNYIDPMAQEDWASFQKGWKQSRECLVIELPKEESYVQSSETAMFFLLEDVRESINSAGVKTK